MMCLKQTIYGKICCDSCVYRTGNLVALFTHENTKIEPTESKTFLFQLATLANLLVVVQQTMAAYNIVNTELGYMTDSF